MSRISSAAHTCIICDAETAYYFSKTYEDYPGCPFSGGLKVDYWRCKACGFVLSRTHQEMDPEVWVELNTSWHHHFERDVAARSSNQPPYADQALAMIMLARNGVVDVADSLDYAAGYGTFSSFVWKYFGQKVRIHDKYVRNGAGHVDEKDLGRYRLVINSAMFEHVISREALDEVNNLVADDGVLMLHTVVCENVPADPNWFYLNPIVHTAFHTNRSMSLLMAQWGYVASVYAPQAKSWFLFKERSSAASKLESAIQQINAEVQTSYFHHKRGFVDYWKGF